MSAAQAWPAYEAARRAAIPVPAHSSRNWSHGVPGSELRKCFVFLVIAGYTASSVKIVLDAPVGLTCRSEAIQRPAVGYSSTVACRRDGSVCDAASRPA